MKNFRANKHILIIFLVLTVPGLLFGMINISYATSIILLLPIILTIILKDGGKIIYQRSLLLVSLCFMSAFTFNMLYIHSDVEIVTFIIFALFVLTLLTLPRSIGINGFKILDAKILGWTAIAILVTKTFSDFMFYSEASHLGTYVLPFACLLPHFQKRFKIVLHVMLILLVFMQMSLTVFAAWIITNIVLNKNSKSVFVFFILLISAVVSSFYLDTRLVDHFESLMFVLDPSRTSNLTVLVFVQGYEYLNFAITNLLFFGTGIDSLAHQILDAPAYQRLEQMGYPLNRSDGGFGLARFSVEVGILPSMAIVISILIYGIKILYLNTNSACNAVSICLWVIIFINFLLRGGGIFDASIVYLAMLTRLVGNEKNSHDNYRSAK